MRKALKPQRNNPIDSDKFVFSILKYFKRHCPTFSLVMLIPCCKYAILVAYTHTHVCIYSNIFMFYGKSLVTKAFATYWIMLNPCTTNESTTNVCIYLISSLKLAVLPLRSKMYFPPVNLCSSHASNSFAHMPKCVSAFRQRKGLKHTYI